MAEEAAPQREPRIVLRVGCRQLWLSMRSVRRVVEPDRLARLPRAPAAVAGLTSVAGDVVVVIDLARLLDVTPERTGGGRLVVVDTPDDRLALLVDEVSARRDAGSTEEALPLDLADLTARLDRELRPRASGARAGDDGSALV